MDLFMEFFTWSVITTVGGAVAGAATILKVMRWFIPWYQRRKRNQKLKESGRKRREYEKLRRRVEKEIYASLRILGETLGTARAVLWMAANGEEYKSGFPKEYFEHYDEWVRPGATNLIPTISRKYARSHVREIEDLLLIDPDGVYFIPEIKSDTYLKNGLIRGAMRLHGIEALWGKIEKDEEDIPIFIITSSYRKGDKRVSEKVARQALTKCSSEIAFHVSTLVNAYRVSKGRNHP